VLAFLAPRIDRAGRAGTALALSPILGGALCAAFVSAGLSWGSALTSLLVLSFALVALRRVLPRAAGPDLRGHGPDAAWLAALVCALVLGAMFVTSEWWRIDSDAWTHAPIVRALREHGVPPRDPWYDGFPLQYAWLYHAWVAALADSTHANPFTLMAWLAVVSLAGFALVAGHFAGRFHGRSAGWATAFVLLGLNGAFAFTLPLVALQALIGRDAGPHVLARAFGGILTDAGRAEDLLRWWGAQTWFGNKFAGSTPFSLGLAAYAAWLASLWRNLERGGRERRDLALFVLLTAATGALHPALLLCTVATIALWFALVVLFERSQAGAAWRIALAAAVGATAPALLFARILAPSAAHLSPPLDLSLPKLLGLALAVLPGLVFAALAAPALARTDGARRAWLLWLVAALAFAVLLRLPGAWAFFTVDKTSYLAWIPLALTGGAAFAAFAARGRWRLVLALLVLGPATLLALGSRLADPRVAWRQPWQRAALVQLRAGLPRDALLVVPPGDLDTPVFLERDAYDMDKIDGVVRGYDPVELARRHALVDTLYRAGRFDPALAKRLEATGRPVFAIWPDQARAWQARTPGVGLRKFAARGMMPTWGMQLPVATYGSEYAVSPLTRSARLP
jgi:hypothetical protein